MLARTALFLGLQQRGRLLVPRFACRCFSTDKKPDRTEWVPPDRPLIGDQLPLHRHNFDREDKDEEEELRRLQEEIDRLEQVETREGRSLTSNETRSATALDEEEELRLLQEEIDKIDDEEKNSKEIPLTGVNSPVDWLQTRRGRMGDQSGLAASIPGAARHEDLFDVEVKHHTLFRKDEIATILDSLGGTDIKVIYDNPHDRRMGGAMGMILVTASRPSQIRILADTLVRQMRRRKLEEVDVLAAQQGPEGDEASQWMVVDCRNFVVHIFEEKIRQALNLDDVWSGKDPLHSVDFHDEDAVDAYVEAHPVPGMYGVTQFEWDGRFRELQKNRWTAPHKPVVKKPRTKKRR